jgi:hypothetical protein
MNNIGCLFSCPVAKVIWGIVAICFGQQDRPSSYEQYWMWIKKALPGGEQVFMLGLAAICWAIWKARNKTCFEKKLIRDPCDIMFSACSFIHYWAGLYSEETQVVIRSGVETMMRTAFRILGGRARPAAPLMIMEGTAGHQAVTSEDEASREDEDDLELLMTQWSED